MQRLLTRLRDDEFAEYVGRRYNDSVASEYERRAEVLLHMARELRAARPTRLVRRRKQVRRACERAGWTEEDVERMMQSFALERHPPVPRQTRCKGKDATSGIGRILNSLML